MSELGQITELDKDTQARFDKLAEKPIYLWGDEERAEMAALGLYRLDTVSNIEVTPEMLDAGKKMLPRASFPEKYADDVVSLIYRAMFLKRP